MKRFVLSVAILTMLVGTATADLEVYLPLDSSLADASGKGRNGVLTNGTLGTNGYVDAQIGKGLDLGLVDESKAFLEVTKTDGDYVTVNYTLPEAGSIALWYKTAPMHYNYESLWDNSGTSAAPADNWECWIDHWGPGNLYARSPDGEDGRWNDDDNKAVYYALTNYPTYFEEWFHVTVTWEKNTDTTMEMNMFINGVLVDTAPMMTYMPAGSKIYLGGGHDGNTYGIGVWDEFAVWSTKLTDVQVAAVYSNGVLAWDQAGIPGDLNGDGAVNSGDLDLVRGNWGTNNAAGDANADGVVNSGDLDIVRANWGTQAAASAVPEPASLLLVLLAGVSLALSRRSR